MQYKSTTEHDMHNIFSKGEQYEPEHDNVPSAPSDHRMGWQMFMNTVRVINV